MGGMDGGSGEPLTSAARCPSLQVRVGEATVGRGGVGWRIGGEKFDTPGDRLRWLDGARRRETLDEEEPFGSSKARREVVTLGA